MPKLSITPQFLFFMIICSAYFLDSAWCASSVDSKNGEEQLVESAEQPELRLRVKRGIVNRKKMSLVRAILGAIFQLALLTACFICVRRACTRGNRLQGAVLVPPNQMMVAGTQGQAGIGVTTMTIPPHHSYPYPPPQPGSHTHTMMYPHPILVNPQQYGAGGAIQYPPQCHPVAPPQYHQPQNSNNSTSTQQQPFKYDQPPPAYDQVFPTTAAHTTTTTTTPVEAHNDNPATMTMPNPSPMTSNQQNPHEQSRHLLLRSSNNSTADGEPSNATINATTPTTTTTALSTLNNINNSQSNRLPPINTGAQATTPLHHPNSIR